MAVRSSMLDLIERVRGMINDSSATVFTDAEIEGVLDQHRKEWRYLGLQAEQTIAPGGTASYLSYHAAVKPWEADAELVDAGYNVLTPATAAPMTGDWSFDTEPSYPVLISGSTYDLYGAAAELLEMWAAKVALDFDFSAGGQTFNRSQKQAQILALAAKYRGKAEVGWAKLIREDIN